MLDTGKDDKGREMSGPQVFKRQAFHSSISYPFE